MLDLAAGTGKLTRVLVRRFARVIAVEPLPGMLAVLERLVPEADARLGSADEIPVPDASVAAVFCAEAFHWFAGAPGVVDELARVLEPGGVLVLAWNERGGDPEPPLPEAFRARLRNGRRRASWPYGRDRWRAFVEAGPFGPIAMVSFPNVHLLDRDTMLANAASWSWIASLPDDERQRELTELAGALPEGTWRQPLRTDVYWTQRSV